MGLAELRRSEECATEFLEREARLSELRRRELCVLQLKQRELRLLQLTRAKPALFQRRCVAVCSLELRR
eukprot:7384225-Prymnesium_polylepis.2